MEESLLSKSDSFQYSKAPVEDNVFYTELSELIKIGNFSKLRDLLQYPDYKAVLGYRDRKSRSALLHLGADKRDEEIISILLEAGANPNIKGEGGLTPLHRLLTRGCRCELCTKKSLNCLEVLIRNKANVNAEDKEGKTPLLYAAEHFWYECAVALLDNGADLHYSKLINGETLATTVVEKLPGVIEKEFDKYIRCDDDDNSKLKLDFGLILQTTTNEQRKLRKKAESSMENGSCCCSNGFIPCETELLHRALKASGPGRETLLTHPLTQAFLHLKWMAVRKYFLVFRSVYFFLAALYTAFVFDIFVVHCPYDWETNGSKSDKFVEDWEIKCQANMRVFISGIIAASILSIMILFELYKLCVDRLAYFSSTLNYAWWILILSVSLTIIPAFDVPIQQWQYPMSAFAVIFAWSMNLVQLGRIPELGVYVEVFARVLKDFGLFLITYSSLLIAFAFGFCILIPDHEVFYSIPLSFLKVLLMMVGDTDYFRVFSINANDRLNDLQYTIPAHIIYTIFILVMTIVLMSLLVGLAVSDIQQLRKEAAVSRSIRLINEIYFMELITQNNILCCGLAFCFAKVFSINRLKRVKRGYVSFSPMDLNDHTFPTELQKRFIPFLSSSPCLNKRSLVRLPPGMGREMLKTFSIHPPPKSTTLTWETYVERTEEKYNDLLFSMQEIVQQNQLLKNQLDYITNKLNSIV